MVQKAKQHQQCDLQKSQTCPTFFRIDAWVLFRQGVITQMSQGPEGSVNEEGLSMKGPHLACMTGGWADAKLTSGGHGLGLY